MGSGLRKRRDQGGFQLPEGNTNARIEGLSGKVNAHDGS